MSLLYRTLIMGAGFNPIAFSWTQTANATFSSEPPGVDNRLILNGGGDFTNCNPYIDNNFLGSEFTLEFEHVANTEYLVGITDSSANVAGPGDIDIFFRHKADSSRIAEYGINVLVGPQIFPGDIVKIESTEDSPGSGTYTVRYYVNDGLIYTSLNSFSNSNKIKCSALLDGGEFIIRTWE